MRANARVNGWPACCVLRAACHGEERLVTYSGSVNRAAGEMLAVKQPAVFNAPGQAATAVWRGADSERLVRSQTQSVSRGRRRADSSVDKEGQVLDMQHQR